MFKYQTMPGTKSALLVAEKTVIASNFV